jgi:hypothetical protein
MDPPTEHRNAYINHPLSPFFTKAHQPLLPRPYLAFKISSNIWQTTSRLTAPLISDIWTNIYRSFDLEKRFGLEETSDSLHILRTSSNNITTHKPLEPSFSVLVSTAYSSVVKPYFNSSTSEFFSKAEDWCLLTWDNSNPFNSPLVTNQCRERNSPNKI